MPLARPIVETKLSIIAEEMETFKTISEKRQKTQAIFHSSYFAENFFGQKEQLC